MCTCGVSKSMFNNMLVTKKRNLLGYNEDNIITTNNELSLITPDNLKSLQQIYTLYSSNMANKHYENIPNDYNLYVELYVMLGKLKAKFTNNVITTLVAFVEHALVGAINSYALYGYNVSLNLDKVGLKKTIDDILTGKNEKVVELVQASGQLNITKSFKLAPVFNYYIIIYGMPAYGVGFDPVKINFLVDILKSKGINPYK
jgi:hypothetical protein